MKLSLTRRAVAAGLLALTAIATVLLVASGASGRSATPPAVGREPSISGTALEGNTLTGDPGTFTGTAPITYTNQWVRCDEAGNNCVAIAGATTTTYKLVAADVGSTIGFWVTAKNADGSKRGESNATAVVSTPGGTPTSTKPPVISGSAIVGSQLAASTGTWVGLTPITYSYQWQRCDKSGNACDSISSATSSQHEVVKNDVGKTLRVKVTGKNSKGKSTAISVQTAVVVDVSGGGTITLPDGTKSVPVSEVPKDERLIVDKVTFNPNPVSSRNVPIEIRVRVKDTRGYAVRDAYVFVRSTPILTSTPTDAQTGTDGWITYFVTPRSDFPLKTGYSVQFYVKAYRKGDKSLEGIYGSRLVQVATVKP